MEHLEFLDVSVSDLVATVTLRRPPVNALSAPMMREIARVFTTLERGTSASVAILTADGDRVFYAGADISESDRRYNRRELLPSESVAERIAAEHFALAGDGIPYLADNLVNAPIWTFWWD